MPDTSSTQRNDAILTYDLGTTRIKVALFDLRGRLIGQRAARHQEYREGNRAWQDADALVERRGAPDPRTADGQTAPRQSPISVSGRGGAAVFIGRDGTVIGQPWSDRRHAAELSALIEWRKKRRAPVELRRGAAREEAVVRRQRAVRARQLRHVLYAKDFLIYRLTGAGRHRSTRAVRTRRSGTPRALDAHRLREPRAARGAAVGHRRTARSRAPRQRSELRAPASRSWSARTTASARTSAPAPAIPAHTRSRSARTRSCAPSAPTFRTASFRFYDLPPGPPRDRRQRRDGRPRRGLVSRYRLRRQRPDQGAALRRDGRSGRRRSGGLPAACASCRSLSGQVAPESRPGASAVFTGLRTSHDRSTRIARVLEGGAFAIRVDLRSDPRVVRRTVGDPPHRQRRDQRALVRHSRERARSRRSNRLTRRSRGVARRYSRRWRSASIRTTTRRRRRWCRSNSGTSPMRRSTAQYETLYRDWQQRFGRNAAARSPNARELRAIASGCTPAPERR